MVWGRVLTGCSSTERLKTPCRWTRWIAAREQRPLKPPSHPQGTPPAQFLLFHQWQRTHSKRIRRIQQPLCASSVAQVHLRLNMSSRPLMMTTPLQHRQVLDQFSKQANLHLLVAAGILETAQSLLSLCLWTFPLLRTHLRGYMIMKTSKLHNLHQQNPQCKVVRNTKTWIQENLPGGGQIGYVDVKKGRTAEGITRSVLAWYSL